MLNAIGLEASDGVKLVFMRVKENLHNLKT